ncbi:MAG TPA: polysaccharide biosynthesis protein [Rhodothermales bacterium]|nr:polysaccharide biosynthesis protein [Rhodothermales bacterium]
MGSPRRQTKFAAALLDTLIITVAFLVAFRIRMASWDVFAFKGGLHTALALTLATYMVALTASGLYRLGHADLHLRMAWRVGFALLIGWAGSVLVTFLAVPGQMAPRSVSAVHWMLSLIGVLGVRGVARQVMEWKRSGVSTIPIRSFRADITEVLDRHPVNIDEAAIQNYLAGRTVLVTGAGGSIGSELTKLLLTLKPFRLVLVDVSEYALFKMEESIRQAAFSGDVVFRIADVRDEDIMRTVFETTRPDVVFHAAAYKHVPLMERHPIEAFRNNTLSTVSLVRLCERFETEQFIFISTDKVVEPSSVLGATKRLGEWYLRSAHSRMQRKIVRFGNVFGSQGSVVELFSDQIAHGGPIRITHPEMTRYFMSAHDACALILQTLLFDDDMSVYMLRMGEPVRIVDLAKKMVQLYSAEGADVEIVFTGVRPGEKLSERLYTDTETPNTTSHPSIVALSSKALFSRLELDGHLAQLESLCAENRTADLRKHLFREAFSEVSSG